MPAPILKYFNYEHLPEHLKTVSKPIGDLARQMDEQLPDGPEKSTGLSGPQGKQSNKKSSNLKDERALVNHS